MEKFIVIEKKRRLIVGIDPTQVTSKHEHLLELEQVDYSTYHTVAEYLESGKTIIYTKDKEIKRSPYWKDFVVVECWLTILISKHDAVLPPFPTADLKYNRQTYEMRIMKNYGFNFVRCGVLNAKQYNGVIHGNKTLLRTTIKETN